MNIKEYLIQLPPYGIMVFLPNGSHQKVASAQQWYLASSAVPRQ